MREIKTGDGKIMHMPDTEQRKRETDYHCECHCRMGNDFYFLPMGSCLRKDKTCSNTEGQSLEQP